jgi:hypothetical protein
LGLPGAADRIDETGSTDASARVHCGAREHGSATASGVGEAGAAGHRYCLRRCPHIPSLSGSPLCAICEGEIVIIESNITRRGVIGHSLVGQAWSQQLCPSRLLARLARKRRPRHLCSSTALGTAGGVGAASPTNCKRRGIRSKALEFGVTFGPQLPSGRAEVL